MPRLCGVFNYALHENDPPKSWSEALITVIHKEGKDPLECGAYRSISLLGGDVKILSSILVNRMQKYLINQSILIRLGFYRAVKVQIMLEDF